MSEVISGMVIDGKFTLSSGMVLEDATVNPGGVLSALAGGTATNLTVEDGASLHMAVAPDTLVQGTSAGSAFVNSDGYLSGYVHEPTSITRIAISSGGTAVDITCVEGWINVSAGGLLSNSYISSYGRLGLNGGDALDVTVEAGAQFFVTVAEGTNLDITSGGKKVVANNGVIDGITADGSASAWYYITSGGSAINTTGNNKMWLAVSNGYASNTILRASGNPTGTSRARLDLRSGGVTEDTFIYAGGSMSVANDKSVASKTYIYDGGILDLVSTAAAEGDEAHLYAKDTYVFSGGTMLIKQNTVVTGELQIEDGAKVTLSGNAATLDFDITDRTTADAALYNNYALITGAANAIHTITVSSTQTEGSYRLADNAAAFAATVTVKDETKTLGTLAVDSGTLLTDLKGFSLTLDEGALALNVADLVIIDDKYTVRGGETLDMAALVDGGKLIVSSGGTATNISLAGGVLYTMAVSPDTLVQVWSNGEMVTNNSGGYLSGYTHNPGDGDTAGTLYIYNGGTATEIVGSNSWIRVSEGGLLSGADIVATGRLAVQGGSALDVTVSDSSYIYLVVTPDAKMDIDFGGHRITASEGVMRGFVGGNGANTTMAQVTAGASAVDNYVGPKTQIMVSRGFVSNTVLSASGNPTKITDKGHMEIRSGGTALDTFIYEGGSMSVSNGQSFIGNTHIYSGGVLTLATLSKTEDPATARFRTSDTYVAAGGTMTVSSGGIITGELMIESGARVTVKSGATLDFDLTDRATTAAALCNDYSLIGGAADAAYTITVSATQAKGTYRLADNAASFAATVTVKTATETLGTLTVGGVLEYGDYTYSLGLDAGTLNFTVADATPPSAFTSGDLNGDGRADIVMTIAQEGHPADGSTGAWLIQENQTAAWGDLSQRESGWEIFGTGISTAGKTTNDVYVKSTGNVVGAWTTDVEGKVVGWVTVGEFDADTQVLGLGDFNGDGQTDLLLRNTNGAVGCYFTSGDVTGWNYFQSLGDEWTVSAIGDLNGDGRDDVILKHDAGFAGSWLTQSDYTMAWADLDTLADGFEIVGCGDFDGDGTSDVLLKKGSYYGAWIVQDGNAKEWMGLGDLGNVTVEQIGDFDADGIDDLRIRTTAGDLGAQLVKGADDLSWQYYGSVGSEWSTSLAAI